MNKYKALTKDTLMIEYRIADIFYNSPTKEWVILRSSKSSKGYQAPTVVKPRPNGKSSLSIQFSLDGKGVTLDLARVVYVWFFEDLTEDDAIVHIDGNKSNVAITNLKKVSRQEARAYESRSRDEASADAFYNLEKLKEIGVGYVPIRRVERGYGKKKAARRRKSK